MIITLSREYGAAAGAVARSLADRLGYRLVDDDLPVVVAARLGTSPEVVEGLENRSPGFGERLLRSLNTAVPEISAPAPPHDDFTVETQREVERMVREAAAAGDVIIVGRFASKIVSVGPSVLRVFLYAPLRWRAAHIQASLGVDEASARSEIARVDAGRRALGRERYDYGWGDPREYDLLLDVSRFGVDGSAAVIAAAVDAAGA